MAVKNQGAVLEEGQTLHFLSPKKGVIIYPGGAEKNPRLIYFVT